MIDKELRIAIYNIILNYILDCGLQDVDNFARKLTDHILEELYSGEFDFRGIINRIRSPFFIRNKVSREDFYSSKIERQIIRVWRRKRKESWLKNRKTLSFSRSQKTLAETRAIRISIDDLDSFKRVRGVKLKTVEKLIPLRISEHSIKQWIAEIIGEPFLSADWGGEMGDLYTSRLLFRGRRTPAAFLLKGKGLRGKLTVARCGKNGDQILRLFKLPAEIYIVQHVGEIDISVIELMEKMAILKSQELKREIYYCVIDGVDTARLLIAYNKIHLI